MKGAPAPAGRHEETMTQKTIQLGDNAEALALAGEHDANLKVLERELRLPGHAARRRAAS